MLWNILLSFLVSAVLISGLWLLRGVFLTPVKPGRNERLSVVITVSGPAPELEQTVDALCWLRANGTLKGEIVVRDAGMDHETAAVAEILRQKELIKLIG